MRRWSSRFQAPERAEIESGLAAARAALLPQTFDALWAEGQRMSIEEAIALARQG